MNIVSHFDVHNIDSDISVFLYLTDFRTYCLKLTPTRWSSYFFLQYQFRTQDFSYFWSNFLSFSYPSVWGETVLVSKVHNF